MATGRVRVYIATSLDGFIAGPGDDLSWLPGSDEMSAGLEDATRGGELTYEAFMADVGALLMGRRTYDVVRGFDVPWPFEDHPVLVATWRPLDPGAPATVRAVAGDIRDMVSLALEAAGGRDVYLDGGGRTGRVPRRRAPHSTGGRGGSHRGSHGDRRARRAGGGAPTVRGAESTVPAGDPFTP